MHCQSLAGRVGEWRVGDRDGESEGGAIIRRAEQGLCYRVVGFESQVCVGLVPTK